jgi:hypothetical protein
MMDYDLEGAGGPVLNDQLSKHLAAVAGKPGKSE